MTTPATEHGHAHVEAFCVMTYRCERCGQRERIWNSRDGVTPFLVDCRACKGPAQHIDWLRDEYRRDYVPQIGERIFRDGTPDEARAFMRQRIAKCKGTQYELSEPEATRVVERAATATDGEFQPGWPNLVTVSAAEAQSAGSTPPEDLPGKLKEAESKLSKLEQQVADLREQAQLYVDQREMTLAGKRALEQRIVALEKDWREVSLRKVDHAYDMAYGECADELAVILKG